MHDNGQSQLCDLTIVARPNGIETLVTVDIVPYEHPGPAQGDFRVLAEGLPVGVFVLGPLGQLEYANQNLVEIFGEGIHEDSFAWLEAIHPDDRTALEHAIGNLRLRRKLELELRIFTTSGEVRVCRCAARDRRNERGELVSITGLVEDITELRTLQAQLERQARHDALTELKNRVWLLEHLNEALRDKQDSTAKTAVLFLDLDGFKLVNDTQGHKVGDELLCTVARRFDNCLEAPREQVARFGGDEFVVVAHDLKTADDALLVAERLHAALKEPVVIGGRRLSASASIGIALAEPGQTSADHLVGDADLAMYEAKRGGPSQSIVYNHRLREAAGQRFDITSDLKHARARNQLRLDYQLIFDLTTGRAYAAEALLRWVHPTLGRLTPNAFINLAEESGTINELGDWVVQQACNDLAQLRANGIVDDDFGISVNVSAMQLTTVNNLISTAEIATATHGLKSSHLIFELTESLPVDAIPESAERIRQLIAHGYRLAIDDFGTGYSSLEYLTMLPFDVLKIDPKFTRRLPGTAAARTVLESMMLLARRLNFRIVAEGIETDEQRNLLVRAGVHLGQGFLFASPRPLKYLEGMLASHQSSLSDWTAR